MKLPLACVVGALCACLLLPPAAAADPVGHQPQPVAAIPPIVPDILNCDKGTMVPLQPFAALTGVTVTVTGRTYTIASGDRFFTCTTGSTRININGETDETTMAPFVMGETVYVPFFELLRALGWKVRADNPEYTVTCPAFDTPLVFYSYYVSEDNWKYPKPSIYLMNFDGTGVIRLTYPACLPTNRELPVFSPDGQTMLYRRGKHLYRRAVMGKIDQIIARGPDKDYMCGQVIISPDSTLAVWGVVTRNARNAKIVDTYELQLLPLQGTAPISKIPGRMPQFSPDGTTIAFSRRNTQGQDEICLMQADGSDLRVLGEGISPYFSPDGSRLVWTHVYPSQAESLTCYVLTGPHAGKRYQATTATAKEQRERCERFIAFSADGQKVIFQKGMVVLKSMYYDHRKPFYEMRLDRTAVQPFTGLQPSVEQVAFTPDRTLLLYLQMRIQGENWYWELFGRDVATGKVRTLLANKYLDTYAVTPDGKRIVFMCKRYQ